MHIICRGGGEGGCMYAVPNLPHDLARSMMPHPLNQSGMLDSVFPRFLGVMQQLPSANRLTFPVVLISFLKSFKLF
jgi:hypothetical protein